jgi:uncharacterized protein (TIGR03382 family)
MRTLAAMILVVWTAGVSHADAVIQSGDDNLFPEVIDITVDVRAQVETTTMVFEFPAIPTTGDYVLTVPSPKGSYAVGVDLDRGAGYAPADMTDEAPSAGAGGSAGSNDDLVSWRGTAPLTVDLVELGEGPLTMRVSFVRLLRRVGGEVSFDVGVRRCPLRSIAADGPSVSITIDVSAFRDLDDLTVTGGTQTVVTESNRAAAISATNPSLGAEERVEVRYAERTNDIDVHFLTHRTSTADPLGGEEGYFLLIADADVVSVASTKPRAISLVVDHSGSMSGDKIDQARDAARGMLDRLRGTDSFNIHVFDDDVTSLADVPGLATTDNVDRAHEFVDDLEADGSTDLNAGVQAGLDGGDDPLDDRYDAVILLSDGLATAGETNNTRIHENSIANNANDARIFTFAIGAGADRSLMEALARSARGHAFVLNNQQAEAELADMVRVLFEDIEAVRVTDLDLTLPGIGAAELYPEAAPDLFNGGQVVVVGRYSATGSGTARLTGDANGVAFDESISIDAPAMDQDNEFIKYVWATEKVGTLLADMARGGDVDQLREQITELGLAYRIQTPYTSFSATGVGAGGDSDPASAGSESTGCSSSGSGAGWLVLALLALALGQAQRRRHS